jgi:hypothetical protein
MEDYGPPVDRLLTIGQEPTFDDNWSDLRKLGIGPEHVADLIRLATDRELLETRSDGPEIWAPIHAWRALGQLRAEPAIGPLLEMLIRLADEAVDDWASEELPIVLGMIGPAAIPATSAIVEDESAGTTVRIDASRVLVEVVNRHPEARGDCAAILARVLERAQWHHPDLNGFLISDLLILQAREAAGVIERAFAGGFVNELIVGTWYDVWSALDLDGEPPPRPVRKWWFGFRPPDDSGPPVVIEPPPAPARPNWQPSVIRTPDDRKERNKARQKLEKKAKGKNRKRR